MRSSQHLSRTNMLLATLFIFVCGAVIPEALTTEEFDISNVVFPGDNDTLFDAVCTEEYPLDINISNITAFTLDISWKLPSNVDDIIIGYQILYWEVITSLYSNVSVGVVNQYTITGLKALTDYFITVRGVCENSRYGVASDKQDLLTKSTFPSNAPTIIRVQVEGNTSAVVQWSPLSDDQWNGIRWNYIIVVADITPGSSRHYQFPAEINSNYSLLPDILSVIVNILTVDHTYIVTISANSSGGLGVESAPYLFKIEQPVTPSAASDTRYVNYWYFLAVPGGIVLAVLITVMIVVCKTKYEKKRRNVQFVRDISTNIDEQKIIVGGDFSHRMEPMRMSLHNRPLPDYPPADHPHTPSVTSMNAHLIDQTSPNQFQRGMSFSTADQQFHHTHQMHMQQHHHHHHHPDVLPIELVDPNHQFRNRSVTSPQIPQLSQPLSDLSSATPSSVFTESNVPHQEETTASSPNTPKAYEVPSDSRTCHQSVSPVMSHTSTLPNPHRPHTASGGMMTSQPAISPHPQSSHSPISFTHSSSDVRSNNHFRPPDVPPHRTHSNAQQGMNQHQDIPTSPVYARPESSLYSEIPGDLFPKITPPTDSTIGRSTVMPTMGVNDGSLVNSDRYSDYSDISGACPPMDDVKRRHLPSVGEYRSDRRSSSDSISSFSTDSQSSSPSHSKIGDMNHNHQQHFNRIGSGRSGHNTIPEEHDYDEANSIITDNMSTVNSKTGHVNDLKDSFKPNPYLSPVDIVPPSTNGHSPSD